MFEMDRPETRAEFERRFHLLSVQLKRGLLHLPYNAPSGLEKVRLLPNGRIDFLSVNEFARLQANMTANMDSGQFKEMIEKHVEAASPPESDFGGTKEKPTEPNE